MKITLLPFRHVSAFSDIEDGVVYLSTTRLALDNLNHEVAHITSGDPDHDEKFRRIAADLGVDVPPVDLFKKVRRRLGIGRRWAANIGNICVAEDAPVWTEHGPRPIADVAIGDLVHSFNPLSGRLELVRVAANFDNGEATCVGISTKSGHWSMATPNHAYYTLTGPQRVVAVKPTHQLLEIDDPIGRLNWSTLGGRPRLHSGGIRPIRDLHVPPFHNYIVDGVVVGNSGVQNMLLDYHLLQAYRKFSQKVLGTEGHWEVLNEGGEGPRNQLIRLYPTPKGVFPVVVLYYPVVTHFRSPQAKKLANDMLLAEAKIMLGHARRKISAMPGPSGGNIGLDGADLVTEGTKMREDLTKQAMEMGEPMPIIML